MSEENSKPVLDEQTLAKLLEAAYVLQEHSRELRQLETSEEFKREHGPASPTDSASATHQPPSPQASETTPPADYTATLAQIVETQREIQVLHLDLENAMALVAERVVGIARASGAAIALLEGERVHYRAVAGLKAPARGTTVSLEKSLCTPCLKAGQVLRCADVNPEFLLDSDECKRRGIESMIAVPVFHNGAVAGGLELYYSTQHAFTEQDVHSCQLMAGLITEALARSEELTWKQSLASERAAILEALEKLQPNLAALVEPPPIKEKAATAVPALSPAPFACRKCGHTLAGEEQFCGQCGSPRNAANDAPRMQSKVASLWHRQEAQKLSVPELAGDQPTSAETNESPNSLARSIEEKVSEIFSATDLEDTNAEESGAEPPAHPLMPPGALDHPDAKAEVEAESEETPDSNAVALEKPATAGDWSSAAAARNFLEQLAAAKRPGGLRKFWAARRGDIYLAVAVLLVAGVIRWGIWSDHPVGATSDPATAAQRKAAPDAGLSLLDRVLIQFGLAEPPETAEDKGNPSVQVWLDERTALYYCPGADLYGKTPKGRFSSQRDAQLDQFEPAYRKPCK